MDEQKPKRRSNSADRVFLSETTQAQLRVWDEQIQAETGGIVSLPLRELANVIIQMRNLPLTVSELAELRERYFDPVKALQTATENAKALRARGEKVDLEELLKKVRMQSVAENQRPIRALRTRRTKAKVAASAADPSALVEANSASQEPL